MNYIPTILGIKWTALVFDVCLWLILLGVARWIHAKALECRDRRHRDNRASEGQQF